MYGNVNIKERKYGTGTIPVAVGDRKGYFKEGKSTGSR